MDTAEQTLVVPLYTYTTLQTCIGSKITVFWPEKNTQPYSAILRLSHHYVLYSHNLRLQADGHFIAIKSTKVTVVWSMCHNTCATTYSCNISFTVFKAFNAYGTNIMRQHLIKNTYLKICRHIILYYLQTNSMSTHLYVDDKHYTKAYTQAFP